MGKLRDTFKKAFGFFGAKKQKNSHEEEEWEEMEFLDSSASEELKKKCKEVFPSKRIDEFENYTITEELGHGSMGIVSKALHKKEKKYYAIKILPKNVIHNPQSVNQFFQEICIHKELSHPNIIHLNKLGVCSETVFIVMEYIAGCSLESYINMKGTFSEKEALKIVIPLLEALDYAHSLNIVHRDLKPANILVEEVTRRPKIADFGIAKFSDEDNAQDDAFGTPAYMAPEQIKSSKTVDIRADIYSVGCILYYMLTGKRPYEEVKDPHKLIKLKLKQDPKEISNLLPEINDKVKSMVQQAMARDLKIRYKTPMDFLKDARAALKLVEKKRYKSKRFSSDIVNKLHKDAKKASTAYIPQEANIMETQSAILMTASRYEVEASIETFKKEIAEFTQSPIGSALAREESQRDIEFEETLISISMMPDALIKLTPAEEKMISSNSKNLLKRIVQVLNSKKLKPEQKSNLNELRYLILLRGNILTKEVNLIEFINEGTKFLNNKLKEMSQITQMVSFNKKIKAYFEYLASSILKTYDQIFFKHIQRCKDYDELECYLENYHFSSLSSLRSYKNLNIIKKIKEVKEKLDENPLEAKKFLDKYFDNKERHWKTVLRQLLNTRKNEVTIWGTIVRSNDLTELIRHLIRLQEKKEFKSISARIHTLINSYMMAGGREKLERFETSLNFIPLRARRKVSQLVSKALNKELEQKVQEILLVSTEERRFNILISLLRNPRYHHSGITLYNYKIQDLATKVANLRYHSELTAEHLKKYKLPEELIWLIYQDKERERKAGEKTPKNCLKKLKKLHARFLKRQEPTLTKPLIQIFQSFGKVNFSKEDSIYPVDGYTIARHIVKYYRDNSKKSIELPEEVREDIAKYIAKMLDDELKKQLRYVKK